jgi:hypothetical protein
MTRAGLLVVLLCGLLEGEARGCAIPVFRYALERWAPSPYEAFVFHRGPLRADASKLVAKLRQQEAQTNLKITVADVADKLPSEVESIWRQHGRPEALPQLIVFLPEEEDHAQPVWTAPLDERSIHRLIDSPVRKRLVSLLTQGEAVVWLLLASGDRDADDKAARMLTEELRRLQDVLKLPDGAASDPELRSEIPLRISFPIVQVSRKDAEEEFLVQALLNTQDGLTVAAGPVVFPIFGRGRVLTALHGEQLSSMQVERWASYLCDSCSCRVKEANPGIDLLIRASWETLLDQPVVESPSAGKPAINAPAIPPGSTSSTPDSESSREAKKQACSCRLWSGAGIAALFVAAVGIYRLRSRRFSTPR